AIAVAAGVGQLADIGARTAGAPAARTIAAGVISALIVTLSAWSLHNLHSDPRYAKEDCRDLGVFLAAHAAADDVVIVNAGYMAAAVQYYYPGAARVVGYPRAGPMPDAERVRRDLGVMLAGHRGVWLVLTRTFHGDRNGLLRRLLTATFREDAELRFPGVV